MTTLHWADRVGWWFRQTRPDEIIKFFQKMRRWSYNLWTGFEQWSHTYCYYHQVTLFFYKSDTPFFPFFGYNNNRRPPKNTKTHHPITSQSCLRRAFVLPSLFHSFLRWRQGVSKTGWRGPQRHLSIWRMSLKKECYALQQYQRFRFFSYLCKNYQSPIIFTRCLKSNTSTPPS